MVDQSMIFLRRKPRTLFAFPAVVAVCLDRVKLKVIETSRYLLVSDASRILLWIVYDASWADLVFFGLTLILTNGCAHSWIKFHMPVLPLLQ